MRENNPDAYELCYVYAPGRLERRQHCFVVTETEGAGVETVYYSGYGATPLKAMQDLKDEMKHSPLSFLLPQLFYRWQSEPGNELRGESIRAHYPSWGE